MYQSRRAQSSFWCRCFPLKCDQRLTSQSFPERCTDHGFEGTASFRRHQFPKAAVPIAVKPRALSGNLHVCSVCDVVKSLQPARRVYGEICPCCWKLVHLQEAFSFWFIAFFQCFHGKFSAALILLYVLRWETPQGTSWHTGSVCMVLSPLYSWVEMPEGHHEAPNTQWALYAWLRHVFHHAMDNTSYLAERALIRCLGPQTAAEIRCEGVLHLTAADACCARMTSAVPCGALC